MRLHEPYVRLFLGTRDAGVGHLFLTSECVVWGCWLRGTVNAHHHHHSPLPNCRRVAWIGAEDGTGVQLPYEAVVVHAVGVDPECFTNPTVMLQITPAVEGGGGDGDDDENGGGEVATSDALGGAAGRRRRDSGGAVAVSSLLTVDDLRFVPANAAAVEAIYEALSAGVASHPVGSDDEGDDDDGADGGEGGEDDGEDGGDLAGLLAFAAAGGRGFYGAPPPVEGQFDAADDDGDAGTGAAAPP